MHRLSDCLMKCLKCMKTFIASWIWFSWLVYELLIKKCKSRRKRCRWIGDYDTKGPPLGIHYANQNAQSRERNVKGKPRTKHTKCAVRADQSNSPNWCFGNYCSGALRPGHSSIYASWSSFYCLWCLSTTIPWICFTMQYYHCFHRHHLGLNNMNNMTNWYFCSCQQGISWWCLDHSDSDQHTSFNVITPWCSSH